MSSVIEMTDGEIAESPFMAVVFSGGIGSGGGSWFLWVLGNPGKIRVWSYGEAVN